MIALDLAECQSSSQAVSRARSLVVTTAAAGALQRAGLIRYKRGNVTIIDRPGLMRLSCECYGVSKLEFDSLLGDRAIRKVRSGRT